MRLPRFSRTRLLAASFALALVPFVAVAPARAVTPVDALRAQVLAVLGASSATTWGAEIDVGGVGAVVSRNPGLPLPPASLEKVPLAVSLLLSTAPNRRLDTTVGITGPVTADGVLRGDLVLTAAGDPVLRGTGLAALARAVRVAGIRAIPGTVWVDDSGYDRARLAPGWKPSFVPLEVGPLSAFAVNGNAWRRDPGFLADPVPANLAAFRTLLFRAGVGLPGGSRIGRPPGPVRLIAVHRSPTIAELVRVMLKDSDNFTAEMLTKELGRTLGRGTTASGLAAVQQQAARFGIAGATLADGSGLSAYNRQTPSGTVRWLGAAAATTVGPLIRSSLPVACTDGTLRRRMCGTVAAGRVWAKTGTLAGVRALAGYAVTRSGRPVTFAIQLSGVRDGVAARAAIDRTMVVVTSSPA